LRFECGIFRFLGEVRFHSGHAAPRAGFLVAKGPIETVFETVMKRSGRRRGDEYSALRELIESHDRVLAGAASVRWPA